MKQEIVLHILEEEYTKEKDITNSLDNKSGLCISAFGVMITIWLQMLPISKILKVDYVIFWTCIIIVAITLLIGFVTLVLLLQAFNIRTYYSINVDSIIKEQMNDTSDVAYMSGLITHYREIILHNSCENEKKSKRLYYATCFLMIYTIFSILSIFIINILI